MLMVRIIMFTTVKLERKACVYKRKAFVFSMTIVICKCESPGNFESIVGALNTRECEKLWTKRPKAVSILAGHR
jgi:hypothetical protein